MSRLRSGAPRLIAAVAGLVVLAAGFGATQVVAARQRALDAGNQFTTLERELVAVAELTGRYPAKLKDLGWRLASVAPTRELADPWGNQWLYRVPGAEGQPFDLGSAGPDGSLGGADDIGRPPAVEATQR